MPLATKEDQREYQRKWIAKRRADFFEDKFCVRCDSTEKLELDHIDPQQKVSHRIWSWSKERQLVEIAKCQVLCEDCHKIKSFEDKPDIQHGTHTMYVYGCRCELCRDAHADLARTTRSLGKKW